MNYITSEVFTSQIITEYSNLRDRYESMRRIAEFSSPYTIDTSVSAVRVQMTILEEFMYPTPY